MEYNDENSTVLMPSSPEDPGLAEDSLQCLQALSSSPSGLQQLVGWGTPEALASCFLRRGGGELGVASVMLASWPGSRLV